MARVKLMAGIASLSGNLGEFRFRHLANGETRVYLGHPSPRQSPPSATELRTRDRFAQINAELTRRRKQGDTRPRAVLWREIAQNIEPSLGSERNQKGV